MKSNLLEDTFAEIVSPELIARLGTKDNRFPQLVEAFGLDPKLDFRHSDLVDVDFSGANLAGYDFTGADLRGSFGVGVSIEGAILAGADLTGSFFEYRIQRAAYFNDNPQSARLLRSLSAEHWTNATLWVVDQISKRKREDAVEVAKALFLDTKDAVLRNQILFFLARAFDDRPAYMSFLLETLASHGGSPGIRRSVIRLIGRLFYNQRTAYAILVRELRDETSSDMREILIALARSVFTRADFRNAMDLIREQVHPLNRRFFVTEFVKLEPKFALLTQHKALLLSLDHGALISDRLIDSAARTIVDRFAHRVSHGGLEEYERAVEKRADHIRTVLAELSEVGLSLTIEPAVAREGKQRRKRESDKFEVPPGRRVLEG